MRRRVTEEEVNLTSFLSRRIAQPRITYAFEMAKQRDKSPEPTLITVQRPSRQQDSSTSSGSGSESSDDEYVVEALLKRRVGVDGDYEIMVKWEGYDGTDEATTWEPEEVKQLGPSSTRPFVAD